MKRSSCILVPVVWVFLLAGCQPQVTTPEPQSREEGQTATEPEAQGPQPVKRVVEIRAEVGEDRGVRDLARYETRTLDPVLEELRKKDRDETAEASKKTGQIRDENEAEKEKERAEKLILRSSLPQEQRPTSLDQFQKVGHRPPVPQFYTGTCWSFAMTSFMEAEVERKTGKTVKLSEMATVYWEYLAKVDRWVDERGDSLVAEGSETNALTRIWAKHGAWPEEAYPGVMGEETRHDHQRLVRDVEAVLGAAEQNALWDRETVEGMVRVILDREMGRPPSTFEVDGQTLEPDSFMKEVLQVDPTEYVEFMSTLKVPFWTRGEFEVPDNWWHDDSYHNVPLEDFHGAIKEAIQAGYSVTLAVDVSEPGKDAGSDVMFIPSYDIPSANIDQIAREYRFAHKVTTDDHAVHLVGFTEHAGHDWFLVKDSGRSARHGAHEGYYFMRDDYVKLKVLAFTVHRDAVPELLSRFPAP